MDSKDDTKQKTQTTQTKEVDYTDKYVQDLQNIIKELNNYDEKQLHQLVEKEMREDKEILKNVYENTFKNLSNENKVKLKTKEFLEHIGVLSC